MKHEKIKELLDRLKPDEREKLMRAVAKTKQAQEKGRKVREAFEQAGFKIPELELAGVAIPKSILDFAIGSFLKDAKITFPQDKKEKPRE